MKRTSVATPLMERSVCTRCGHLHRYIIGERNANHPNHRLKCTCCGDDCAQVRAQQKEEQEANRL